ncbi:iron-sulfur flavoprotein [Thermotomaculum hydrothermale]|uniref:Iron-sulfur flavoprotein n=1 Tax=Thermotomaculum hydrothermale TaxID=981385 RepID=A0A7R6PZI2_9BACT|nr:flavodoxin family protein [Thermotomaculum hydrothermale]BBB32623.1 iron-sulfur flavoprotein [Thermotomaculum hydrothermale]
MKITVFNGSPRKFTGNTHRIVKAFLKGCEKAGAKIENIFLASKKINHCMGCFHCWTKTPGKCIQRDEMDQLIPKFMSSDIVVLATPLYTDSVSSILKKFFERLLPIVKPHFERVNGETKHIPRYEKYPDFVFISNCGYPEYSQFQVLEHFSERLARELNAKLLLKIFRTQGELLSADHILLKPIIYKFLKSVEKAGYQLVKNGHVEKKIIESWEKPLIPIDMFLKKANEHWDEKLKKIQ